MLRLLLVFQFLSNNGIFIAFLSFREHTSSMELHKSRQIEEALQITRSVNVVNNSCTTRVLLRLSIFHRKKKKEKNRRNYRGRRCRANVEHEASD